MLVPVLPPAARELASRRTAVLQAAAVIRIEAARAETVAVAVAREVVLVNVLLVSGFLRSHRRSVLLVAVLAMAAAAVVLVAPTTTIFGQHVPRIVTPPARDPGRNGSRSILSPSRGSRRSVTSSGGKPASSTRSWAPGTGTSTRSSSGSTTSKILAPLWTTSPSPATSS